jgi:hypothetical protein
MGFTVENKQYSVVKFIFIDPFTANDMLQVLEILTKLLDTKKPFAFFVDTRTSHVPPLNAGSSLLTWMRSNKHRIKDLLLGSCVILGNTITNNIISKLLKGVFKIQPTVSPNLLTTNYDIGEKFVTDIMKTHFKINSIGSLSGNPIGSPIGPETTIQSEHQ